MSPAEVSLFGVLRLVLGNDFLVFSKVRMTDVLEPVQSGREGKSAFCEISQKHVDFVICRAGSCEIAAAVELDDATHRRSDRAARDYFVEVIFAGAGIPLIRLPVRASYSPEELRQKLEAILKPSGEQRNEAVLLAA